MLAHESTVIFAKGGDFLLHHNERLIHLSFKSAQSHRNLLDLAHQCIGIATKALGGCWLIAAKVNTLHFFSNHDLQLLLNLGGDLVRHLLHGM